MFTPSVLYNIMANEFVSEDYKDRLRVAARSGRDSNTCLVSMSSSYTAEQLAAPQLILMKPNT